MAFPILPARKANKDKPIQMMVYQYDDKPLGRREPLLLVHGLLAEYCRSLRWSMLTKHLTDCPDFSRKYKIYFVRYDSLAFLDKITPQLQAKIAELYKINGQKPITIVALSMGGNIVYQSMLTAETNKQIKLFLAMATPFHGSPLFSADWMHYTDYKTVLSPLTRVDLNLGYKIYFHDKANLLTDLRWDNCDQSVPDIGHFTSLLPFGPKGDITVARASNPQLFNINQTDLDKSKMIVYGGFLPNSYQWQRKNRIIGNMILLPYQFLTITVPAHTGSEHLVLKMLNNQISKAPTTLTAQKRADSKYVHDLNDGITPVLSALFLPNRYCSTTALAYESDFARIKPLLDVGVGRVFRNIDHLTFIDGYRPLFKPLAMRDELNPQMGNRDIFSWILLDLDCTHLGAQQQSSTHTTYN